MADQAYHEWERWKTEVLERLCRGCAGSSPELTIQVYLTSGEVGVEIARFATARGHDAIVLVRRSRFEEGRAQVLRTVLELTTCPVLLVATLPDLD